MKERRRIELRFEKPVLIIRSNGYVVWSKILYEGDVRHDVNKHPCPYPGRPLPQDTFRTHQDLMNRNGDELSEIAEDQLDAAFDNEFLEPPY